MEKNNGWIKLHRKLLKNDLIKDFTCLTIFIWCLLKANRDGKLITGRFKGSEELGIPPSTFRNGLSRLVKKFDVLKIQPFNKFSVISILNWAKYQQDRPVLLTTQAQGEVKRGHTEIKIRADERTHNKIQEYNTRKEEDFKNSLKGKYFTIGTRKFYLTDLYSLYQSDRRNIQYQGSFETYLQDYKRAWGTR